MRPYGDPRTLEQRRLKAIRLLAKGLGPGEIAGRLVSLLKTPSGGKSVIRQP